MILFQFGHTNIYLNWKGVYTVRYNTSDNDKNPRDNQAKREEKNTLQEKNRKAGKNQYSKKTDHL